MNTIRGMVEMNKSDSRADTSHYLSLDLFYSALLHNIREESNFLWRISHPETTSLSSLLLLKVN